MDAQPSFVLLEQFPEAATTVAAKPHAVACRLVRPTTFPKLCLNVKVQYLLHTHTYIDIHILTPLTKRETSTQTTVYY